MQFPKFIRKAILKTVGLEVPIEKKTPLPVDALVGFTDEEVDEIMLGSSFKRIAELREYILDNLDVAFPAEKQSQVLKKLITKAFDRYIFEEAKARK